ncbi:MAG: chorismate-binding protein [Bacteroidia bacterium]|nr:chorismate-binding protein [Bacteroidia bacterium]
MSQQIDKNINLKALLRILLVKNIPFVSYRLPNTPDIYTFIQLSNPERISSFKQIEEKRGFIVVPFSNKKADNTFFISPDIILKNSDFGDEIFEEINRYKDIETEKAIPSTPLTTSSEEFLSNVTEVISLTQRKRMDKVVISRIKVTKVSENFRTEEFFCNLSDKYPTAMTYLFQIPEAGCWAGATPELLLTIENKNNTAKTVSLAGTQYKTEKSVDEHIWEKKEREEQEIVSDFIENILKESKISGYKRSEPRNIQAGQLIHLQTTFEFPLQKDGQQTENLLLQLHPTPAIGGFPKQSACNFILENERHSRRYYCGFLGPVNFGQQTNLYVNLRCTQLIGEVYVLYAGAGITASSVATDEWNETENKMKTIQNVIDFQPNHNPR